MLGRCTPLHLAVTNNHRSIVFLLLSHGAEASSRDRFACSPMHYVKSLSVAKLLVQYGGKVLDYNAKKKHAVESVFSFMESIRKDQSIPLAEREATLEDFKILVKFLEKQAEAEYRVKLESLRRVKKQAKEKTADLTIAIPRSKKQT
ncbi:putative ankyrin repeat protein [Phytophthora citrophthora]|uniref:Ankyrin repeat protein n=1 Tax=Phytophthora citrophthora TaxID=4793 RepID=A0AAD9GXJ4_9STRA|nr:putative ankyrin repeat protein [Phytophthora citrophthora]